MSTVDSDSSGFAKITKTKKHPNRPSLWPQSRIAKHFQSTWRLWIGRKLDAIEDSQFSWMLNDNIRNDNVSVRAVRSALYFGRDRYEEYFPTDFFIIFPHLERDLREDFPLLKKFHKRVVAPTLDQAWKETGNEQGLWTPSMETLQFRRVQRGLGRGLRFRK